MQKTKTLFVTSFWPYPINDGGRDVAVAILEAVKKHSNVDIVAFIQEKSFNVNKASLDKYTDSQVFLIKWKRVPKLMWLKVWLKGKSYFFFRDYNKDYLKTLEKLISQTKYDHILLDRIIALLYVDDIFKLFQKYHNKKPKITYFSHNVESNLVKAYWTSERNPIMLIYKLPVLPEILLSSRFEINTMKKINNYSISYFDMQFFKDHGVKNIKVFPPAFFKGQKPYATTLKQEKQFKLYISMLANFKWYQNVQGLTWFLKKIWPKVLKHVPDAKLRLGGKAFHPRLLKLINKTPNIELLGYIKTEDKDTFHSQDALTLAPVLIGSGLKIKVLQAFRQAVPLVVTTKALEGFASQVYNIVPHSDDPDKFADYVIELLKNPEKRLKLRKEMYKYNKDHFDIQNMNKFIKELLNGKKTKAVKRK